MRCLGRRIQYVAIVALLFQPVARPGRAARITRLAGKCAVKVDPRPSTLSISSRPPWR
jgi:hypothetical protein